MTATPEQRAALRRIREVRSKRPANGEESEAFAAWREAFADALRDVSQVLPHAVDRRQALSESEAARAEADHIRRRLLNRDSGEAGR
ncbi:hypothetical protein GCM10010218_35290 [Streptomyces mashuensis]|uniref:Uncharacterized protein n=1 Tax=Streptomyces mashuensis TaxID=33904 RepID=A0A919ECM3_9ACTN|nr:hypothetical protein GCM10010218_35290 [Streptomyces mashuensis]